MTNFKGLFGKAILTLTILGQFGAQARTNVYNPYVVGSSEGVSRDFHLRNHLDPKFFDLDEERIHAGFNQNYFFLNFTNTNLSTRPSYITEVITDTITKVIPGRVIPGHWRTTTVLVPREVTRTEIVNVPREVTRTETYTVPVERTRTETYTVPVERTRTETYTVPVERTRTEIVSVPYTHTYTDYETRIDNIWHPPVTTERPGPWSDWSTTPVQPFNPPDGNYTIEGWSERLRAQYLMSLDPNLNMNDAMIMAEADLNFSNATCTASANGCTYNNPIRVAVPSNFNNVGGNCSGSETLECGEGILYITGTRVTSHGGDAGTTGGNNRGNSALGGGNDGEHKPLFASATQSRTREIITETTPGYNEQVEVKVPVEKTETRYRNEEKTYTETVNEERTREVTETVNEERTREVTETVDEERTREVTETVEEERTREVTETVEEERTREVTETVNEEEEREVTETVYDEEEKEEWVEEEKEEDQVVEEEVEREVVRKAEAEWKVSFAPAYFLSSESGKFIYNLTGGMNNPTCKGEVQTQQTPRIASQIPQAQVTASDCGLYVKKQYFTIDGGFGATATINRTNSGLLSAVSFNVTLMPTLGGSAYSTRHFDSLGAAKKRMNYLRRPKKVADFNNWKSGDTLEYDVHGGITFSAGAGFYGLSAGVSYLATGSWKKTYQKVDENTVFARIDKDKLMSFGAYVGAGLASLNVQKFFAWEKGIAFTFNTGSREGRDLLQKFMKGKLKAVQKAAGDNSNKNVVTGFKRKGKGNGHGLTAGVAVPYLPFYARKNKTSFINDGETNYFGTEENEKETVAGSVTTFKGKVLFKSRNDVEGFFASAKEVKGQGMIRNGQFAYSYQANGLRDGVNVKTLKKRLRKLQERTAMFDLLGIQLPENKRAVGDAEIKLAVQFDNMATLFLVKNRNKLPLEKVSTSFVEAYLSSLSGRPKPEVHLCTKTVRKRINIGKCRGKLNRNAQKSFRKMRKALTEMAGSLGKGKKARKTFVRAYKNFGTAMMDSPIAFQTILNLTKGKGAGAYFSLETTETKKHETVLKWTALP